MLINFSILHEDLYYELCNLYTSYFFPWKLVVVRFEIASTLELYGCLIEELDLELLFSHGCLVAVIASMSSSCNQIVAFDFLSYYSFFHGFSPSLDFPYSNLYVHLFDDSTLL